MSKAPGQTYANQQKIKAAKEQQRIFEWRKRRPDLTAAEFDEAVRLHNLWRAFSTCKGDMSQVEFSRYSKLFPFHVVELPDGADIRFGLSHVTGELGELCPQVFRTREPAQKLADWLCVVWHSRCGSGGIEAPRPPAPAHSTAARYSFETGACEPVPSILKKQAE